MFGFRKGICFQDKCSEIYITSVIIQAELCLAKEICLIECTVWVAFNLGLDAKYFSKCCPVIFSGFSFLVFFFSVCNLNIAWKTELVISLWELLFCFFTVVSECLRNVNVSLAFLRR